MDFGQNDYDEYIAKIQLRERKDYDQIKAQWDAEKKEQTAQKDDGENKKKGN